MGPFSSYASSFFILLYVLPLPLLANTQNKTLGAVIGFVYSLILGIVKWYVLISTQRDSCKV